MEESTHRGKKVVKVPRRRRGKETILVDTQILNWRKKRRELGLIVGPRTEKQKEINAKERARTAIDRELKKKGFFG